jgi:molecular chaperone GrpE
MTTQGHLPDQEHTSAPDRESATPGLAVYAAGGVLALLLAASATLFIVSVLGLTQAEDDRLAQAIGGGLGVAGLAVAGWLIVHWESRRQHAAVLLQLPTLMLDLDQRIAAIETVRREHAKTNMSLKGIRDGISEDLRSAHGQREALSATGEQLRGDLGEFRGELIEIRQQLVEERDSRNQLDDVLMAVADRIHRKLDLDGIRGVLDGVSQEYQVLGLDLIHPEPGTPFDERIHSAAEERAADGIPPRHVVGCLEMGYRRGSQLLRAASVIVSPQQDDAPPESGDREEEEATAGEGPPEASLEQNSEDGEGSSTQTTE